MSNTPSITLAKIRRVAAYQTRYRFREGALNMKRALQRLSPYLAHSSFRLQGQMDIHPASLWHDPGFVAKTGGFQPLNDAAQRPIFDLDPWDSVRRDMLVLLLRDVVNRNVPGDMAELGVYQGHTAKLFHHYAPERRLLLFDTFEGFHDADVSLERSKTGRQESPGKFSDTSLESVQAFIQPQNGNVVFYKGFFPASLPPSELAATYAFVHLDADLYAPIYAGLEHFYPRLAPGGFMVVHDYNAWHGSRAAVDEFFSATPAIRIPMPDKSGSILIVKPPANA